MTKYLLLIISCLVIMAGAAHAANTPDGNATRGTHWPTIIDAVLHEGIAKIGDFDVQQFDTDAKQILWTRIEGAPSSLMSGDRHTAFYVWKGKKVYINDHLPAEASASIAQLELHEALGATGYNDDNYALSTALNTLARMRDPVERQQLVRSYSRTVFLRRIMVAMGGDGGASLVTRGGDLITLYIKDQVLNAIMGDPQNKAAATPGFLSTYAKIDFEPLQNQSVNYVAVEYTRYFQARADGEREAFKVLVPMKRWSQGDAARKTLIQEIVHKVTEIFPSYNGTPLMSFVPPDCPSGTKPVSFPTPSNSFAREIQEKRGALLRNCPDPMNDDGHETSDAIVAPALPWGSEPKEPGFYRFNCVWRHGVSTESEQIATPSGANRLGSINWKLDGVGDYWGFLAVAADGKIRLISIVDFADYPTPQRVAQPAANPLQASTQLQVSGTPVSLSCKRVN